MIKKCNHGRIVSPCLFIQNYYNGLLLDQYMVYVIDNRTDKVSLRLPYLTFSLIYFLMDDDVNLKQRMCSTSPWPSHMTQCDLHTWLIVTFTHGLLWHLHTSHCGNATHDSLWPSPTTRFDLHTWLIMTFTHDLLWPLNMNHCVTFTHDSLWPLHMTHLTKNSSPCSRV